MLYDVCTTCQIFSKCKRHFLLQESYEKQHFLLILLSHCCILDINLHSSLLVSAVQTENVFFSKDLIHFSSQFTCSSSFLKSWLWPSYIILTSFISWQLFVGRWLCIPSKYTLKTLKRNEVLKEHCDLLVLLVTVPMQEDEGLISLLLP